MRGNLGLARAAIGDVGCDGVAEQAGVLGHHPYLAPVPARVHLRQGHPIYQYLRTTSPTSRLHHLHGDTEHANLLHAAVIHDVDWAKKWHSTNRQGAC